VNGTETVVAGGQALLSAPAAPVHVSRHVARPGRRTLVIADLADLRGPAGGSVELPIWLFWHPNRTFDLDDPAIRRWVYQIVLREASRPEDLTLYLNGEVLAAIWPDLRLPRGVRRAWEELHPSLALPVVASPVAASPVAASTVAASTVVASTVAV
jgi:hypothetical protein